VSDLASSIDRLIGRPWSTEFDCWEFVRAVYADAYQVYLPQLPGVDGADPRAATTAVADLRAGGDWLAMPVPRDGDCVTMGQRFRPHHVGIRINGRIAHCDQAHGVIVSPLPRLAAIGWHGFQFFRHLSQVDQP
jgi:cell wall-associated NlpC family hydrolase